MLAVRHLYRKKETEVNTITIPTEEMARQAMMTELRHHANGLKEKRLMYLNNYERKAKRFGVNDTRARLAAKLYLHADRKTYAACRAASMAANNTF